MNEDIDILKIAKKLIDEQLNSLTKLRKRINKNFKKIVELIAANSGRLIIIGLGKSGIIR